MWRSCKAEVGEGRPDESASAFNSERGHIMTEVRAIVRDAAAERNE